MLRNDKIIKNLIKIKCISLKSAVSYFLRNDTLLLTEAIELGVLKYHTCLYDNMRLCKLQKRRTTILSSVGLSNNKIKTLRFFQADLFCCFTTGYFLINTVSMLPKEK